MSNAEAQQIALPAGYSIRPLLPADAPALEWDGEFSHFRRVYAVAFQRAEAGNASLWGVEAAGGQLVGQLFVLLNSENDPQTADGRQRSFIHSFRIQPQHRNRGLGSGLLRQAEADLRARGFTWVALNVAEDNPGAIRLYQRHGYSEQHRVTGYWSFVDHEGRERHIHEPGWRMGKKIAESD